MKKIILKRKAAPEEAHRVRMVPAIEMEDGVEYLNTVCTVVLTLEGVQAYEGPLKGTAAIRETLVYCKGVTDMGEDIKTVLFGTMGVIADEPELVKAVKDRCTRAQARASALRGAKASGRRETAAANGEPARPKAPRGAVDPRTGCSLGSQGHVLGTIMLDNKCGPATRPECVRLMTACLVKDYGMEERKAKPLAQSWYSTLWTRKAQIYQAGR